VSGRHRVRGRRRPDRGAVLAGRRSVAAQPRCVMGDGPARPWVSLASEIQTRLAEAARNLADRDGDRVAHSTGAGRHHAGTCSSARPKTPGDNRVRLHRFPARSAAPNTSGGCRRSRPRHPFPSRAHPTRCRRRLTRNRRARAAMRPTRADHAHPTPAEVDPWCPLSCPHRTPHCASHRSTPHVGDPRPSPGLSCGDPRGSLA
jgi:hypothetical protein